MNFKRFIWEFYNIVLLQGNYLRNCSYGLECILATVLGWEIMCKFLDLIYWKSKFTGFVHHLDLTQPYRKFKVFIFCASLFLYFSWIGSPWSISSEFFLVIIHLLKWLIAIPIFLAWRTCAICWNLDYRTSGIMDIFHHWLGVPALIFFFFLLLYKK